MVFGTLDYNTFFYTYISPNGFNIMSTSINPPSTYTPAVIQPVVGSVVTINSATVTGGVISIIKSDGTIETVFSSVDEALTCLQTMHLNGQYYLQASDDITIINVSGSKLLIIENTMINMKLLNSYCFQYIRGKIRCIHRQLSNIVDLTDALESVGYKTLTSSKFTNNRSLQEAITNNSNRPHIQIVDLHYLSITSSTTDGSLLEDVAPIVYSDAIPV